MTTIPNDFKLERHVRIKFLCKKPIYLWDDPKSYKDGTYDLVVTDNPHVDRRKLKGMKQIAMIDSLNDPLTYEVTITSTFDNDKPTQTIAVTKESNFVLS